ncbi:hypothetical protein C1645_818062 [Glomus cerebriforme]|uniref:Protein kinase domain-containing protein n=1 Tax=Glomus cerebriforme TaxID=658196 RepID=A0A397TDB8_9GLOM|nr:hypothetical protein C1645_818062 [Glomus cerebriforme]
MSYAKGGSLRKWLYKSIYDFQDSISRNYGVLPYITPEVIRHKPYNSASDIYSFAIIMCEFTSGFPPFNNRAHDHQLCLSICKGERPKIIENTPKCYIELKENVGIQILLKTNIYTS